MVILKAKTTLRSDYYSRCSSIQHMNCAVAAYIHELHHIEP